jgi:hypothetical protein
MDDPLPTTAATPSLDKGGEIKGPAPNNPPFLMAGPFSLDTPTMNDLLPTTAIPSSLNKGGDNALMTMAVPLSLDEGGNDALMIRAAPPPSMKEGRTP